MLNFRRALRHASTAARSEVAPMRELGPAADAPPPLRVAIVGRANVGKSASSPAVGARRHGARRRGRAAAFARKALVLPTPRDARRAARGGRLRRRGVRAVGRPGSSSAGTGRAARRRGAARAGTRRCPRSCAARPRARWRAHVVLFVVGAQAGVTALDRPAAAVVRGALARRGGRRAAGAAGAADAAAAARVAAAAARSRATRTTACSCSRTSARARGQRGRA